MVKRKASKSPAPVADPVKLCIPDLNRFRILQACDDMESRCETFEIKVVEEGDTVLLTVTGTKPKKMS